jgi:hypothetical protein
VHAKPDLRTWIGQAGLERITIVDAADELNSVVVGQNRSGLRLNGLNLSPSGLLRLAEQSANGGRETSRNSSHQCNPGVRVHEFPSIWSEHLSRASDSVFAAVHPVLAADSTFVRGV